MMSHPDPDRIAVERGVLYGSGAGEPLLLDVHRPLLPGAPRPAVLLIDDSEMVYRAAVKTGPEGRECATTDALLRRMSSPGARRR